LCIFRKHSTKPRLAECVNDYDGGDNDDYRRLQAQTLAPFGAASSDDGTATTGLHANQETVSTGTTNFRGLISAFHDSKGPKCGKALDYLKKTCLKKISNESELTFPRKHIQNTVNLSKHI
jgi:hypothetical protein